MQEEEEENFHLLHQSGANAVITRRLIFTVGEGLDITEREIGPG